MMYLTNIIILPQVPFRGGKPSAKGPPPDMPSFSKREEPPKDQRGEIHSRVISGVVKGGEPPRSPNYVQDHSKSLNPCRSWEADPLECLRRSLLAPTKTMTLATPLRVMIICCDHHRLKALLSITIHYYLYG